jgi:hypothetical protein
MHFIPFEPDIITCSTSQYILGCSQLCLEKSVRCGYIRRIYILKHLEVNLQVDNPVMQSLAGRSEFCMVVSNDGMRRKQ